MSTLNLQAPVRERVEAGSRGKWRALRRVSRIASSELGLSCSRLLEKLAACGLRLLLVLP